MSDVDLAVNTFVEERVQPAHRDLFKATLEIIARAAPEFSLRMRGGTEKYYGVPVFRGKRDAIAISPSKSAVTVSFGKGAQFADPDSLLGGAGKTSRTLKLASRDQLDEDALRYFVRQAVELDES